MMHSASNRAGRLFRAVGSAFVLLGFLGGMSDALARENRPNFLVIVADDLGYSDIGAFGGEIETPNIDALVQQGRVLTNFQAGAACSPTRAMLMSGADHHLVGLGQMAEGTGQFIGLGNLSPSFAPFGTMGGAGITYDSIPDGYAGYLNDRAISMPEMLRDSGYNTYMTGKWHLAFRPVAGTVGFPTVPRPESFPNAKGFQRSFAMLDGTGSHFAAPLDPALRTPQENAIYSVDDVTMPASALPADFYSSNYYTDKMIEYIGTRKRREDKPFFAYVAYTAPHLPLQAPQQEIDAQRGRYDEGYEVIRARRVQRMKALGILPRGFQENPGLLSVSEGGVGKKRWVELTASEKARQARLMEIYAAMVHNMDTNIGRLVQHLKDIGEYNNTMIVFMSDNGAEGAHVIRGTANVDNSLENLGKRNSVVDTGERWAEVSATPFRLWKYNTGAEGGTSVPAVIKMPHQQKNYQVLTALAHVTDILPTVLELARVDNPGANYKGRSVVPISGVSLTAALSNKRDTAAVRNRHAVLADELFFNSYVKKGKWKLSRNTDVLDPTGPAPGTPYVPFSEVPWRLFDISADRGETNDVAGSNPDVVRDLLAEWEKYVADKGVLMIDHTYTMPRDAGAP